MKCPFCTTPCNNEWCEYSLDKQKGSGNISKGGTMIIKDTTFGEVELEFFVDRFSAVDSYVQSGYSLTLDRALTDVELESFSDVAQDYAYSNGSLNHN